MIFRGIMVGLTFIRKKIRLYGAFALPKENKRKKKHMRPRARYIIKFYPRCVVFKPVGLAQSEEVNLTIEEAEAMRLKHLKEFDQSEAAEHMGISQSTFQRILASAHKKVAYALVYGRTIKII